MTFLLVAVVVFGSLIAWLVYQAPRRALRLQQKEEARKARIEFLTGLLADWEELTDIVARNIEQAVHRPGQHFEPEELIVLASTLDVAESALPGLEENSPILDRYFKNLIAIIRYVLQDEIEGLSRAQVLENALGDLYRSLAVGRSSDQICLLERRLAVGQPA